jgi:thioredoxin-dependent peroxiredoxin
MSVERFGDFTAKGNPLTIIGERLQVGDKAPDFTLMGNDLSRVRLSDFAGKVCLISVVPSLDTGLCDAQTRRFNEEAVGLGDDVVVLTVSAEHPFNQRRWCGAAGIDRVQVLSDHMDMNFGTAYGTYVKEWRLEQRSIFVVDADGLITYLEYLPEISQPPDYEAAVAAAKAAAG